MDSLDLDLLALIKTRDNYYEYKDYITKGMCVQESWTLVQDINSFFEAHPDALELDAAFKLWFRINRHPNWKPEKHQVYDKIITNILETDPPEGSVFEQQLEDLRFTSQIDECERERHSGRLSIDDYFSEIESLKQARSSKAASHDSKVQEITISDLANQKKTHEGYFWRLEDLNKSIGPIGPGDFIVVGKRPEVGGTSFLVSELSFMLEQTKDGKAILFNNEEAPDKVYTRMISSALNLDYRTLLSDPTANDIAYKNWKAAREFDLYHDNQMTLQNIERHLQENEYDLVGINVLLKVGGTGKKEDHDKFETLGVECRRMAQRYSTPIIAIVQADPSAEGERYITQDRIYKSKTAIQGEADALIMIGRDFDEPEFKRFINVAKNKIPPAKCTENLYKHVKAEVHFDIDTGRFTTVNRNFKTNSRYAKPND